MMYKEWELELKRLLSGLPEKEIEAAIGYYSEIYGDKRDAGFSDDDILGEFGSPSECADRIRAEADEHTEIEPEAANERKKFTFTLPEKDKLVYLTTRTLFAVLPLALLALAAISAILSFALGSAGIALGGVAAAVLGLVNLFSGNGILAFLSMLGLGMAGLGLGFILAVVFLYTAKRAAVFAYKFLKGFYVK